MSELLHGWYVDASPGCGATTPQKCGNIIPTVGIVGTSTLTQPATTDVSTLGGRSLNTPGVAMPTVSTKTTRAPFYLLMKDVVWFDGHSALYHLPLHADDGNFSMSFWYNPYEDENDDLAGPGTFGEVYAGPTIKVKATDPGGNELDGTRFFRANPTSLAGDSGVINYGRLSGTRFATANYTLGSNFVTDPIDDMQGWCHIMLSVQRSGGTSKMTLYIDETAIEVAKDIGDVATMPFSDGTFYDSDGTRHCWTIGGRTDQLGGSGDKLLFCQSQNLSHTIPSPGGSATFVTKGGNGSIPATTGETNLEALVKAGYEDIGTVESVSAYTTLAAPGGPYTQDILYGLNPATPIKLGVSLDLTWVIPFDGTYAAALASFAFTNWLIFQKTGSSKFKGSLPTDGCGLIGAITELWIAPGQFIDWSVAANRQKFHTGDDINAHFAPVDLGDDGSTPTGTKPLIYCTGSPTQFKINRATGKLLTVYRNSLGGFVGELLDYLKPPL